MQRLLSLDTSFEKLGDKAEALHAAQTVQAELQLHLHESLQTGVHATNGLVDQIRTSTAYLQSAVEDTSIKVAEMASLSGFTDVFFKWSWAVLVILAASLYSGKAAGYIARCLGKWIWFVALALLIESSGVVLLLELMGLSDRLLRTTTALLPLSSPSIGPSPLQTSTKMIYLVMCSALFFILAGLYTVPFSAGASSSTTTALLSPFAGPSRLPPSSRSSSRRLVRTI